MPSSDNFIGGISFATTSFLSTIPLLNATTALNYSSAPLRILKKVWKKFFFTAFLLTVCALLLMQHVITRRLMRISQFSLRQVVVSE